MVGVIISNIGDYSLEVAPENTSSFGFLSLMESGRAWEKKLGPGGNSKSLRLWFKTYLPEEWIVGILVNNIASDYNLEGNWRHFSIVNGYWLEEIWKGIHIVSPLKL